MPKMKTTRAFGDAAGRMSISLQAGSTASIAKIPIAGGIARPQTYTAIPSTGRERSIVTADRVLTIADRIRASFGGGGRSVAPARPQAPESSRQNGRHLPSEMGVVDERRSSPAPLRSGGRRNSAAGRQPIDQRTGMIGGESPSWRDQKRHSSAAALQAMRFPDVWYPGLIPEAGRSSPGVRRGQVVMAFDIAAAIAAGRICLGDFSRTGRRSVCAAVGRTIPGARRRLDRIPPTFLDGKWPERG